MARRDESTGHGVPMPGPGGDPRRRGRPRLFWLGAHKLLVHTELARLRELGFEVFNPPYLSHVYDQSAQQVWDEKQQSTLPKAVFERLSRYNFFYNHIDRDIAELLNEHFDGMVVTIVARWAVEAMRTFRGPIVFRTYGQTSMLSADFEELMARPMIEERPDFHFLPHASEVLDGEARWLADRAIVVPYCLGAEIFSHAGSWNTGDRRREILITAPNILGNPFHLAHYSFLKEYFFQDHFRFCGVQYLPVEDSQVMQTLPREEQLRQFSRAAGYLYTYRDPRVCYLPPIEMMVMGGPVAYFGGSLLATMIGKGAPGEVNSIGEAHVVCGRLLDNDTAFIDEVKASQQYVKDRYDPKTVWPIFDREMLRLLPKSGRAGTPEPDGDQAPTVDSPKFVSVLFRGAMDPESLSSGEVAEIAGALGAGSRAAHASDEMTTLLRDKGFGGVLDRVLGGKAGQLDDANPLLGGPQLWFQREAFGRRNFVHDGGHFEVGRWLVDDESGSVVRLVEQGDGGFALFGPYIQLQPGRYRVKFVVRSGAFEESRAVGFVDAVVSLNQLFFQEIFPSGSKLQQIHGAFEVTDPGALHEFRVNSNGLTDLEVHSVTIGPAD